MDEKQAVGIAKEVLWQLVKLPPAYNSAYAYIVSEMDITDKELEEANRVLNPDAKKVVE